MHEPNHFVFTSSSNAKASNYHHTSIDAYAHSYAHSHTVSPSISISISDLEHPELELDPYDVKLDSQFNNNFTRVNNKLINLNDLFDIVL